MDDIRIYGYSESELIKALIIIDNYLKGFGLSLNAKKTSIEEVINNETDKSIIKFFEYDDERTDSFNSDFTKEFSNLAEQDSQTEKSEQTIILTKDEDIKKFWFEELQFVEKELPKLFTFNEGDTNIKELSKKVEDREILNLCFKYRLALRNLAELKISISPDQSLLKYWIYILKHRFWRADQVCWVLNYYKRSDELKKELLTFINDFIPYEWFRHQIFLCLTLSQDFSAEELQKLFHQLRLEQSYYSRWALYKLLLYHSRSDQFYTSLIREISKESNFYMKKELLYYAKKIKNKNLTKDELNEYFGI
jgi:hypothetical protein